MSRCNECEHLNVCLDYSPLTVKFAYTNGFPCKHFSKRGYTVRLPIQLNKEQIDMMNNLVKVFLNQQNKGGN